MATKPPTLDELRIKFEDHQIRRVKLGAFDIDGVLRGKYISIEKFFSSAQSSLGFCDVIFGWDIADALYDNVQVTGWHTGYPDAKATIDLSTFRLIPWEQGTAFFLLDIALPMSPRRVFRKMVAKASERGYKAYFGSEYEFWIFRETAESIREKAFQNMTPLSPGMFGYSILRASQNQPLALDLMEQMNGFNVPLEGFHTETGPGVYEAAIAVDSGLAAADKAALFKTAAKEICARHQCTPTFMAKWNADLPGSSGHIHQSLWTGTNVFDGGEGAMSKSMRHYIAGLVEHLPEVMALICPTVNSYKRTVPGAWAPVNATWAVDNRTVAVRAIPGGPKSSRIELRLSGADMNPYLAMAASLACGLEGMEKGAEPPDPASNAYDSVGAKSLPRNLTEATRLLKASEFARKWLGDEFIDHYCATREWEVRQCEKAVTSWELLRYFESV